MLYGNRIRAATGVLTDQSGCSNRILTYSGQTIPIDEHGQLVTRIYIREGRIEGNVSSTALGGNREASNYRTDIGNGQIGNTNRRERVSIHNLERDPRILHIAIDNAPSVEIRPTECGIDRMFGSRIFKNTGRQWTTVIGN